MVKMNSKNFSPPLECALSYLPHHVTEAVISMLDSRRISAVYLSEIRLRTGGACAIVARGEILSLGLSLDSREIKEVLRRMTGGAVFAHRDEVCRGYVSLAHGVRVGVVGYARYEGGDVVGVSDVSSLVIRIPSGRCDFAERLYLEWLATSGGILICSPAGGGKTTALRALARLIGSGERPRRVVVVDERCELDPCDYTDAHVDILRGYKRSLGVDIAIRTMSAEVLMVDEISSLDDATAMLGALGAGVTVIATAHADSLDGAMKRDYIRELAEGGLFLSACVITRAGRFFDYKLERVDSFFDKSLHGMGDI